LLPDVFRGEVTIAPTEANQQASFPLPGIEGLASLAGIAMPASEKLEEHLAVLRSRDFVWRFIREYDLMRVLFEDKWDAANERWEDDDVDKQPNEWDAYRFFTRKVFSVNKDAKTGLVQVTVDWYDPEQAADWANKIVQLLNEHLRMIATERSRENLEYLNQELEGIKVSEMRQTLYQLIEQEQRTAMIVNTQKEYAFRVLDPAVPPDKKIRPKRAVLTILAGMLGFLLTAGFIIFRHGYRSDGQAAS
jgi:capsule polysaccharide export protein KpsE/RkpR